MSTTEVTQSRSPRLFPSPPPFDFPLPKNVPLNDGLDMPESLGETLKDICKGTVFEGMELTNDVRNEGDADALLACALETRDLVIGELFASERRYRRASIIATSLWDKLVIAREQVGVTYSAVEKLVHFYRVKSVTPRLDLILHARDLPGRENEPPMDIAYVYAPRANGSTAKSQRSGPEAVPSN